MLTPLIIAGSGTTPFANAKALIEDYIAGLAATNGDIEPVICWALDETSGATHVELFDWLHDPNDADAFDLAIAVRPENLHADVQAIVDSFDEDGLVLLQRPGTKAVQLAIELLKEEDQGPEAATLLVLWDDAEDQGTMTPAIDAMEEAAARGIEIRDLCAGLQTIEVDLEDGVGDSGYPTLEELEAMELADLKELAAKADIEIPKRSRATTYVAQLHEHYRGLEAQGAVEKPQGAVKSGGDVADANDLAADLLVKIEKIVEEVVGDIVGRAVEMILSDHEVVREALRENLKLQGEGITKVISYTEDTNARIRKMMAGQGGGQTESDEKPAPSKGGRPSRSSRTTRAKAAPKAEEAPKATRRLRRPS